MKRLTEQELRMILEAEGYTPEQIDKVLRDAEIVITSIIEALEQMWDYLARWMEEFAPVWAEIVAQIGEINYTTPHKMAPRPPRYAGPKNKGNPYTQQPPRVARSCCRKMRRQQMAETCDRNCIGCIYSSYVNGSATRACMYYLQTGNRRPCPPGKDCTVKSTGKKTRGSAWRQEHGATWEKKMQAARKEKAVWRTLICPECGRQFETPYPHQIYCCKQCCKNAAQKAYRERQKNKLR